MWTLNYCDCDAQNPDRDEIFRPTGSGDYLFLLIQSPMDFLFPTHSEQARPGACLLYTPGFPQHYRARREFLNSYVHFTTDGEAPPGRLPENRLFYPPDPEALHALLRRLQFEFLMREPHAPQMQALLLEELLLMLCRAREGAAPSPEGSLQRQFQRMRWQMLTHCGEDWPLERLCQIVNLSKTQVFAYYRQFFHQSPRAELSRVRMERAKNLLTNETMQVQQVAQLCGYGSVCHFSRYFKKLCGCSPAEYARRCRSLPAPEKNIP